METASEEYNDNDVDSKCINTSNFVVIVVQNVNPDHEHCGKWLAVKEGSQKRKLWWLPAGHVEKGETFQQAALRETLEEAGICIELKGILRVEWSPPKSSSSSARLRVVFYAEPSDPCPKLKEKEDEESSEAKWFTVEELRAMTRKFPPLRGPELVQWSRYITEGGTIYPLSFLKTVVE